MNLLLLVKNISTSISLILEMGRVKNDHNLTSYTKQQVETRLSEKFAPWFVNQTQAQTVIQIFDEYYKKNGTADDDHLAWLQFAVDVRISVRCRPGSIS